MVSWTNVMIGLQSYLLVWDLDSQIVKLNGSPGRLMRIRWFYDDDMYTRFYMEELW